MALRFLARPVFSEGPADQEPASILRQPVSNRRTQWRVLSNADAGSGEKLAGADEGRSCFDFRPIFTPTPTGSHRFSNCFRKTTLQFRIPASELVRAAHPETVVRTEHLAVSVGSSRCAGTADFVYVRGHGPGGRYKGHYHSEVLADWGRRIRSWKKQGRDVFVYFDNDQKSAAPADALKLRQLLES